MIYMTEKMNVEKRKQLIERIKTLEGPTTGEERSNLLGLRRTSYGLEWEDRPEEAEEHRREAMPVLNEDKNWTINRNFLPYGVQSGDMQIIEQAWATTLATSRTVTPPTRTNNTKTSHPCEPRQYCA